MGTPENVPFFGKIPAEMRARRQWVLWRMEERQGHPTKVPYSTKGEKASVDDSATWASFPEAVETWRQLEFDGIGFVFAPDDGFAGIDLDHAIDPRTDEILPEAREIINRLGSYTEVSQSYSGIHVIVKAVLPGPGHNDRERGREMYDRRRYFVMTGNHLERTPESVEDRQDIITSLYSEWFPAKRPREPDKTAGSGASDRTPGNDISDEELLGKAGKAKNGAKFDQLWKGQWQEAGYSSQSEADAALLSRLRFWTRGDKDRSFRLFAESGLNRDKWERDDYRQATWKAVDHGSVYDANPSTPDGRAQTSPENGQKGGREKAPYAEMASEFAATQHDASGRLLLRYWQGSWWSYKDTHYSRLAEDDLESDVMAFLRSERWAFASINTRNNIAANLQASDLCGLPSSLKNPSWISSKTAADGWLPTMTWTINVVNIARSLNGEHVAMEDMFRPNSPDLFATFGVGYAYDGQAQCPKWLEYLAGVQPLEADRQVLQMLAGLSLVPWTKFNVFFVFFGDGGTGKGVFLYVLTELVGRENTCCLPLAQFADKFSTWKLTTHLLNIVGDLPTDGGDGSLRHMEGVLKDACDGGMVPVEHKGRDPGQAPAIARNVFATNSLPTFADRSAALWDRLRIIAFDRRFRGTSEERLDLRREIAESELSGVLNWAIAGLAMLMRQTPQRFPEHSKGAALKDQHKGACDVEGTFLREHVETCAPNSRSPLETDELQTGFRGWLVRNGHRQRTSQTLLAAVQRVFGVTKERIRTGTRRPHVLPGLRWQDGRKPLEGFGLY